MGTWLRDRWWHKKPITYAVGLWIIVGFAALLLIVFLGYSSALSNIEVVTEVYPSNRTRPVTQLPSVFGTVVSIEDGVITVESKQSFDKVLVDDVTNISRVGGGSFNIEKLSIGAKLMATGYDRGEGQLLADALVVLEE